jgi:secreted trypsin-like serine protease
MFVAAPRSVSAPAGIAICLAAALLLCPVPGAAGEIPGPAPSDQVGAKGRVGGRDTFSLRADALTYVQVGRRLLDTSNKVIGGAPAPASAYPWQVSIGLAGMPQSLGHFCSGSLISASWIVTAAHCLRDVSAPDQIQVKVGSNVLSQGGEPVKVVKSVVHPKWDPVSYANDLALLQLASSATAAPVRLLEPTMAAELFPEAVIGIVSGWGYTRDNKATVSNVLRHLGVQVVSNTMCNGPQSYPGQVADEMVCAGFIEAGQDACQGDGGGPLMVVDKKGGLLLAGIASWGKGCAQPNLYGVYTRIAPYASWINENVK